MNESTALMFTIPSWYVIGPIFIIGLLGLFFWMKRHGRKEKTLQFVMLVSLLIYLCGVIHFVFFPIDVNIGLYANQTPWYKTVNWIPILTIDVKTFVLNVIMLIPLGMYVPFLRMKTAASAKTAAKFGFMMSLSIELLQLLIRVTLGNGRSTDINDLLANTLGAVIGYLIVKSLFKQPLFKSLFHRFQS
ncbi:VanZ family protein [Paenibacillus nanensis]|uniref:VanZ family protein n=1 Tax=Paenibacillus nanensis TaxID=393251 RepID=A0A3A1VGN8_9BACL|nr:VanZ family protein [Paenibacillus nanensis]RIX60059.1 VanZ family protein [Paenibacillus nanensis]